MRLLVIVILFQLTLTTECHSQRRQKHKVKEIKTDTVDVFGRFDNSTFKEKNVFWSDKNEIGVIQTQWYDTKTQGAGYSIELTIIFYDWQSIELNKDYNLADLKAECRLQGHWMIQSFNKPQGKIQLLSKSKDKLIFNFDIQALATNNEDFLIYKGERTFKPDY